MGLKYTTKYLNTCISKVCHVKNFGTRDLRHANLPDRDDVFVSPPTSPIRTNPPLPPRSSPAAPSLPPRKPLTSGGVFEAPRAVSPTSPIFRPNRTYNPIRPPPMRPSPEQEQPKEDGRLDTKADEEDWEPPVVNGSGGPTPSHTGRGTGGLPRTVPLGAAIIRSTSPTKLPTGPTPTTTGSSDSEDGSHGAIEDVRPIVSSNAGPATPSTNGRTISVPLVPTGTGVRYGAALGGRMASPMTPMGTGRQWGGGTPVCPKCQKTVYFAEQVRPFSSSFFPHSMIF